MTDADLQAIRDRREKAREELAEVCRLGPRQRFRMSIPVQPDDTDVLISGVLSDQLILLRELARLRGSTGDGTMPLLHRVTCPRCGCPICWIDAVETLAALDRGDKVEAICNRCHLHWLLKKEMITPLPPEPPLP